MRIVSRVIHLPFVATVLQCLVEMRRAQRLLADEVRECAGHPHRAVYGAGAHAATIHCVRNKAGSARIEQAVTLERCVRQVSIEPASLVLPCARREHALAYDLRGLAMCGVQ